MVETHVAVGCPPSTHLQRVNRTYIYLMSYVQESHYSSCESKAQELWREFNERECEFALERSYSIRPRYFWHLRLERESLINVSPKDDSEFVYSLLKSLLLPTLPILVLERDSKLEFSARWLCVWKGKHMD